MGVEKNVVANVESGNPYRYFDEERGQWCWKVDIDSDYVLHTAEPIARIAFSHDYEVRITDLADSWVETAKRYKRLYCEYCGCISGKEHGTCEHCGAPLKEMDE